MTVTKHLVSVICFAYLVSPLSYTVETYKKNEAYLQATRQSVANGYGSAPEFDSAGHWYARGFDAGNSKNLDFLIDTGSTDCLIGSYYYHKGPFGSYTGKKFTMTYYTASNSSNSTETVIGKVYDDKLSFANLSYPRQELGIFPSKNTGVQAGIIGFAGRASSSFDSPCWFNNLCNGGYLEQCRFGLAYGTNKTGKQVIGTVNHHLFPGSLTVAPRVKHPGEHWGVRGDVIVAGKVVDRDALLLTDSGTDRIFGPLAKIRPIYDLLGYSYTYQAGNRSNPSEQPAFLRATFPCDASLDLGFRIPSAKTYSTTTDRTISKPRIFNVTQAYYDPKPVDGNCTSILWGTNQFSQGLGFGDNGWLIGQAFHEGHYIDHNLAGDTMGFADLLHPQAP